MIRHSNVPNANRNALRTRKASAMQLRTLSLPFLIALTGAAGCAATPVEEHWGEAHRRAALVQTVDPDAGAHAKGPEGLDPRTAELVTETYEKNQRKERSDPEEIFLLRQ